MMDEFRNFRQAVSALWADIGLDPPRFVEPGRIQLRVGAATIDLVHDSRGWLAIEIFVFTLPSDELAASNQIRRVLESSVGFVIDHDAGTRVRTLPSGRSALSVWSSYQYRSARPERLRKTVEDVLHMAEFYLDMLSDGERPGGAAMPHRSSGPAANEVIFRP